MDPGVSSPMPIQNKKHKASFKRAFIGVYRYQYKLGCTEGKGAGRKKTRAQAGWESAEDRRPGEAKGQGWQAFLSRVLWWLSAMPPVASTVLGSHRMARKTPSRQRLAL